MLSSPRQGGLTHKQGRITEFLRDRESDTERLPLGWHRDPTGGAVCGSCWKGRYLLRAIVIPIVRPANGTWREFRESLRTAWEAATRPSNWAVCELAKADVVRTPEMKQLPKMKVAHPYPSVCSTLFDLTTFTRRAP